MISELQRAKRNPKLGFTQKLSKIGPTKISLLKGQIQWFKNQSQCWRQLGMTWQRGADVTLTGPTKYDTWRSLNG